MNGGTPRRNMFYSSIKKVIEVIMNRNHNFERNFKQSYSRNKRKIKRLVKSIPEDVKQSMIKHYETSFESQTCKYSESRLISQMMDTTIPCSHLYSLGVEFPKITPPKPVFHNITNGDLIYEYNINNSPQITINSDYLTKVRRYVYKDFVNKKLQFEETPTEFVLGYPAEVFQIIDEGIISFYE